MPRVEFATFGAEARAKPSPVAEPPSAPIAAAAVSRPVTPDLELPLSTFLRVLLIEEDPRTAERISDLLQDILGNRYARDWIDDPTLGIEAMRNGGHDLYLVADGRVAEMASELTRSCNGPVIVLAARPDDESDLRIVAAGAADYVPLDDLTPDRLERAIHHALVRQQGILRTFF